MKVLVTGGNSELGQEIAAVLAAQQGVEVRLTDRRPASGDIRNILYEFWLNALSDDQSTHALVEGIDQVIHTEPFAAELHADSDDDWVDVCTRGTYNLLHAACLAGVSRFICVSSLAVFNSIDTDFVVTTGWKAQPRPVAAELGPHLAEFVCREFAHAGAISIAVARLGALVKSGAGAPSLAQRPRFWVRTADAVSGLVDLLTAEPPPAADQGFFTGGGTKNIFHPHRRIFTINHYGADNGGAPTPPVPPILPPQDRAPLAKGERVVLFGANGLMGPETVKALRDSQEERQYPVLVTDVGQVSVISACLSLHVVVSLFGSLALCHDS